MDQQQAGARWEQLALFPPDVVRIDFVVFLDAHDQLTQYGWAVRSGEDGDYLEIEVRTHATLQHIDLNAGAALERVIRRHRDGLPPFP